MITTLIILTARQQGLGKASNTSVTPDAGGEGAYSHVGPEGKETQQPRADEEATKTESNTDNLPVLGNVWETLRAQGAAGERAYAESCVDPNAEVIQKPRADEEADKTKGVVDTGKLSGLGDVGETSKQQAAAEEGACDVSQVDQQVEETQEHSPSRKDAKKGKKKEKAHKKKSGKKSTKTAAGSGTDKALHVSGDEDQEKSREPSQAVAAVSPTPASSDRTEIPLGASGAIESLAADKSEPEEDEDDDEDGNTSARKKSSPFMLTRFVKKMFMFE